MMDTEEIPSVANLDVVLEKEELGGWNKDNSPGALMAYLVNTQQGVYYDIEVIRRSTSITISVPETGHTLSAVGTNCAMALVHQLYRMGILSECAPSKKARLGEYVPSKKARQGEYVPSKKARQGEYVPSKITRQGEYVPSKKARQGCWDRENSQKALEEFLERTGQAPAAYRTERGKWGNRFNSFLSIFIPETGEQVDAQGHAVGEMAAKMDCATVMCRKLYRMGALKKFDKNESLGGWNKNNSTQGLVEYLQKPGRPPAVYKTWEKISSKGNLNFFVSITVFVPEIGISVKDEGKSPTKENAERNCAQKIVRKLYGLKVLGTFQEHMEQMKAESINVGLPDSEEKGEEPALIRDYWNIDVPGNDGGFGEQEEENPTLLAQKKPIELEKSGEGGWNELNSRKGLNEFLEKTGQPPAMFTTEKAKHKKKKKFASSLSVCIAESGEEVSATRCHRDPLTAEINCATAMAQRLYQMGVLEAFGGKKGSKKEDRGGWNTANSQQGLDEFLEETEQPPVVYQTVEWKKTKKGQVYFITTASVSVPGIEHDVIGDGMGKTKEDAEKECAENIVRQLYRKKVLGECPKKEKPLPYIPVSIPDDLITRVKNYVHHHGVTPVVPSSDNASPSDPQSLILFSHRHFAQFPNSKVSRPRVIPWSPPIPNWNTWKGCEIGKEPWASKTISQMSRWIENMEANKFANEEVQEIQRKRKKLPVAKYRCRIINTVAANQVTLIKGATGCGKSTQVVQYLLESFYEAGRGAEFNAIVSQPRRICAISLAERVAAERNEGVGQSVGYGVRFDSVCPRPYGSIFFCTVGVLLKKMEKGLRGVSHVIIDEIHERDINTDFLLIVLREMVKEYPDLRIILMSATVDTEMFTNYFGGCPVIEMRGRSHPVKRLFLEDILKKLDYMPPDLPETQRKQNQSTDGEIDEKMKNLNILDEDSDPVLREAMSRIDENDAQYDLIEKILLDIVANGEEGAVLIFLPGWLEIMMLLDQLSTHPTFSDASRFVLLPLHSQLPSGEQRKVFDHFGKGVRKIIISTNIAESSVTIDDVVYVIDSCKVRETNHIASLNMLHFDTVWASRSNIIQRCGRAGRVRPGIAYELCSSARFEALEEHRTAEILRSPLTSIALTIKSLRLGSISEFLAKAIERPSSKAVEEAENELKNMGALDDNLELTKLGKIIARLPVEPIVGKAIVLAASLGIGSLMCELAAASSFISPFVPTDRKDPHLNSAQRSFAGNRYSDHAALIAVNQAFSELSEQDLAEKREKYFCKHHSLNAPILKSTADARNQLIGAMTRRGFPAKAMAPIRADVNGPDRNLDLLTSLLITAYYPNISFHRGKNYVLTLERFHAFISRMSVLASDKEAPPTVKFPSPLIACSEKIKNRAIFCSELSLVSAVQLILFGSKKVECVGQNLVRLDNMILLEMDVDVAATLIALRPCVEKHLIKTCLDPKTLLGQRDSDRELISILRELSSPLLFAEAKRR